MTSLELPRSESIVLWEVRRRHLIGCIYNVNEALHQVAKTMVAALNYEAKTAQFTITAAGRRRLVFNMIATGIAPTQAKAATKDLVDYLETKDWIPKRSSRRRHPGSIQACPLAL